MKKRKVKTDMRWVERPNGIVELTQVLAKRVPNYTGEYWESWAKLVVDFEAKSYEIIESYFQRKSDEMNLPLLLVEVSLLIEHIQQNFQLGDQPMVFEPIMGYYKSYPHLKYENDGTISGFYHAMCYVLYFSKEQDKDELEIALTKKPIHDLWEGLGFSGKRRNVYQWKELPAIRTKAERYSIKMNLNNTQ